MQKTLRKDQLLGKSCNPQGHMYEVANRQDLRRAIKAVKCLSKINNIY
jgi:hypothetical protein